MKKIKNGVYDFVYRVFEVSVKELFLIMYNIIKFIILLGYEYVKIFKI